MIIVFHHSEFHVFERRNSGSDRIEPQGFIGETIRPQPGHKILVCDTPHSYDYNPAHYGQEKLNEAGLDLALRRSKETWEPYWEVITKT